MFNGEQWKQKFSNEKWRLWDFGDTEDFLKKNFIKTRIAIQPKVVSPAKGEGEKAIADRLEQIKGYRTNNIESAMNLHCNGFLSEAEYSLLSKKINDYFDDMSNKSRIMYANSIKK